MLVYSKIFTCGRRRAEASGPLDRRHPGSGADAGGNPLPDPRVAVTVADGPVEASAFCHACLIGAGHAHGLGGSRRPRRRCCACDQMNDQPGGVQHALLRSAECSTSWRPVQCGAARTAESCPIPPSRRGPVAARPADVLPSISPASPRSSAEQRRRRTRNGMRRSCRSRRSHASSRSDARHRW